MYERYPLATNSGSAAVGNNALVVNGLTRAITRAFAAVVSGELYFGGR
jgi:hypothetical protein